MQEKAAFIFCVEDRALFCRDCDQTIHSTGSRAANHQRFLATGIRVALHSNPPEKDEESHLDPPLLVVSPPPTHSKNAQQNIDMKIPSQQQQQVPPGFTSPSWAAVDELLHFSDFDSSCDKVTIHPSINYSFIHWCIFYLFVHVYLPFFNNNFTFPLN